MMFELLLDVMDRFLNCEIPTLRIQTPTRSFVLKTQWRQPMNVDLPTPFGPSNPTHWPN